MKVNKRFNNIYITGDTHGNFVRIINFCEKNHTTTDDLLIILGDAGINYYLDARDKELKSKLANLPITLFCVHGNHEEYPEKIDSYVPTLFCGNLAYIEPEYPNLVFAMDGATYDLNDNKCLVLGGAYSVDKYYRLVNHCQWFESEQISDKDKLEIEEKLVESGWAVDYVLSHTCPYNTRPTHMFLSCIDQSTVDSSMEVWLQRIADNVYFKHWYFGHYHDDWDNGKYSMLYTDIILFPYLNNGN